jgi:hypothetical protein
MTESKEVDAITRDALDTAYRITHEVQQDHARCAERELSDFIGRQGHSATMVMWVVWGRIIALGLARLRKGINTVWEVQIPAANHAAAVVATMVVVPAEPEAAEAMHEHLTQVLAEPEPDEMFYTVSCLLAFAAGKYLPYASMPKPTNPPALNS